MKTAASALALVIALALAWIIFTPEDDKHTPSKAANELPKPNSPDVEASKAKPQTANMPASHSAPINNLIAEESPLSPIDRIRAIQDKTALHQAILKDHDTFTRYPANNQKIESSDADPTAKRYLVDERTTFNEDKTLALTAWTSNKFYLQDDTVKVFVTLQDENRTPINTSFAGHLIYNERQNLQTYDFSDSNSDGIHELSIPVVGEESSLDAGIYKLLIVNSYNELVESVAFVVTDPQAALTGNYRDRVTGEGDLLIEVEIDVLEANRYYMEGSLYSSTDDPIGQSSHAENLVQGKHWLPLKFFGLLIHDAGEPGPYVLKNLSLSRVVMPMQRLPLIVPDYHTQGYTLEQFSNRRYEK